MNEDKLARVESAQLADPYAPDTFDRAMQIAENIAKSRLFGITTKEAAFVVLATGHELGLSPMQSLRGIHVIEGRPSPSADMVAAIVIKSGLAEYFREVSTTDTESTWETKRKGNGETRRTYTYTIKDAEAAGLVKPNSNWFKYRRRMLAARAKAFLGRDVYPDLLLGLITAEEMQGPRFEPEPARTTIDVEPEPAPEQFDATGNLEALIAQATADELPGLADLVRKQCPKGHPDRERLATALQNRKAEVSRAA